VRIESGEKCAESVEANLGFWMVEQPSQSGNEALGIVAAEIQLTEDPRSN
jgi:hypothetical protein